MRVSINGGLNIDPTYYDDDDPHCRTCQKGHGILGNMDQEAFEGPFSLKGETPNQRALTFMKTP